jgi:hypothetical protein
MFNQLGSGTCSNIECADPQNECLSAQVCNGAGNCGTACV